MNVKTVSRQLTPAEASLNQERITNRRELQRILAKMEEASTKAAEIPLRQAKNAARS